LQRLYCVIITIYSYTLFLYFQRWQQLHTK
jgi:hypothetical protein